VNTFSILTVASAIVVLIGAAGAALSAKEAKEKNKLDSAKFTSLGQCKISPDARLHFTSARNRFRGALGGSSYGDIFFAGAGNRMRDSADSGPTKAGAASTSSSSATSGTGYSSAPSVTPGATGAAPLGDGIVSGEDAGAGGNAVGLYDTAAVDGASNSFGPVASNVVPSPNPEPASLLLIGTGLEGLFYFGRGKRLKKR